MTKILKSCKTDIYHHITQGSTWLQKSAHGMNTAILAYAAFELRLAIERLAIHYWVQLLGRKLEEKDLSVMESFKRVENQIYELAGHQKEINKTVDFMNVVMETLEIPIDLQPPNIGLLSNSWRTCSQFCHISWTLHSTNAPEIQQNSFKQLQNIRDSLQFQAESITRWPRIRDPDFDNLRKRYIAGEAGSNDIREFLCTRGSWARYEPTNGDKKKFTGRAIPPKSN